MAANTIEYLKHGKALCGKVFAAFVETFNWHNDFCRNLKGDADLPGKAGATGRITVDRTDPSNPIIRLESPYVSNGEDPEEKPEPEEPEDPYVPPTDEPENPDDDGSGGVTSLNGETGDMEIVGGRKVNVETDGKTITVSLDESKEDPEPEPGQNTNCDDHPGSEDDGGVPAGGGVGGPYGDGVPAGGDGNDGVGCNC